MKFGIESYSLSAPYSVIISIFFIIGFYKIGKIIFKINFVRDSVKNVSSINYQYIILTLLLISIIFYPLTLFVKLDEVIFKTLSIIILSFGIVHTIEKLVYFIRLNSLIITKNINIKEIILTIYLFGFFLLSLGPITDADSLDYHISVPLYVLNNGLFPKDITWFHAAQAGLGEIPIIFGLAIGAEQFGSLCQFSGLISIFGILKKNITNIQNRENLNKTFYLILLFFSIPVLIFLNSTVKPQIILISYSSLAFVITIYNFSYDNKKNNFFKFFLITLLLFASYEGKFSFILSSFIIWSIAAYKMIKGKHYENIFLITILFLFIAYPSLYWKYLNYDGNFINKIYFPLFQAIEGYDQLYESLNQCEFPCSKTFFLIPNSLGRYTESIGVAIFVIIIIFIVREKNKILVISSIFFYLFVLYNFGKFSPRFIIEPILWSIILIKNSNINFELTYFKFFKTLIILQSFVSFLAILVGIFTISIGSLSAKLKDHVLKSSAYGYDLSQWVNKNFDGNKKILYTHRSISFLESEIVHTDFLYYTNNIKYLLLLKEKKPDFLVIQSNSPESHKKLIACTSSIYRKKENFFKQTSRNYFNKKNIKYSAYIYYFDYKKLPDCYLK